MCRHMEINRSVSSLAGDIIADMDQTVDPCVDFYEFACGGWLQSNSIPATSSSVSQIGNLAQAVDEEIRRTYELW